MADAQRCRGSPDRARQTSLHHPIKPRRRRQPDAAGRLHRLHQGRRRLLREKLDNRRIDAPQPIFTVESREDQLLKDDPSRGILKSLLLQPARMPRALGTFTPRIAGSAMSNRPLKSTVTGELVPCRKRSSRPRQPTRPRHRCPPASTCFPLREAATRGLISAEYALATTRTGTVPTTCAGSCL
ncbi:hypothetical protein [Falsiroseomonas sp. HW251]|uniref:hypothetical protein n=1 Tax=Falsiroseomonas sp. HW251 TaxID=3390998 RepID=UPI003D31B8C8